MPTIICDRCGQPAANHLTVLEPAPGQRITMRSPETCEREASKVTGQVVPDEAPPEPMP